MISSNIKNFLVLVFTALLITSCGGSGSDSKSQSYNGSSDGKETLALKSDSVTMEKETSSGDRIILSLPSGALSKSDAEKIKIEEINDSDSLKFRIYPEMDLNKTASIIVIPANGDWYGNEDLGISLNNNGINLFLKQYRKTDRVAAETVSFGEFSVTPLSEDDISMFSDKAYIQNFNDSWQKTKSYINSSLWIIGRLNIKKEFESAKKIQSNIISISDSVMENYLNKDMASSEVLELLDIFRLIGKDENSDTYIKLKNKISAGI